MVKRSSYSAFGPSSSSFKKSKRYNPIGFKNPKSLRPQERNYVDTLGGAFACDTTGTITLLNTVAQGVSTVQRVGKKCYMTSLQIRGSATANAVGVSNDIAMLIVYDKRPTGALPAITDILVGANSTSFTNDVNTGRFKILKRMDKILLGGTTLATNPLVGGSGDEGGATVVNTDSYMKMPKLPVVYKALGTGAIADIEEGALYLVTVGNVVAGTAAATLNANFRLRFTEN